MQEQKDLGLDFIKDLLDDRVAKANLANSEQAYIYSGRSFELSDLDEPGIILTNLQREQFKHVETYGKTVELVIVDGSEETRIVFLNDSVDRFKIQLADRKFLEIRELDEHIHISI